MLRVTLQGLFLNIRGWKIFQQDVDVDKWKIFDKRLRCQLSVM